MPATETIRTPRVNTVSRFFTVSWYNSNQYPRVTFPAAGSLTSSERAFVNGAFALRPNSVGESTWRLTYASGEAGQDLAVRQDVRDAVRSAWLQGSAALWPELNADLLVHQASEGMRVLLDLGETTTETPAEMELPEGIFILPWGQYNDYKWVSYGETRGRAAESWEPNGNWKVYTTGAWALGVRSGTSYLAIGWKTSTQNPSPSDRESLYYMTGNSPQDLMAAQGQGLRAWRAGATGLLESTELQIQTLARAAFSVMFNWTYETCEERGHVHRREERWSCGWCGHTMCPIDQPRREMWSSSQHRNIVMPCTNCEDHTGDSIGPCQDCGRMVGGQIPACNRGPHDDVEFEFLCGECIDANWYVCPPFRQGSCLTVHAEEDCISTTGCSEHEEDCDFEPNDQQDECYEDHWYECSPDSAEPGCWLPSRCHSCPPRSRSESPTNIHNYSYKPTPIFYGVSPKKFYIGMELEIAFKAPLYEATRSWLPKLKPREFFYAKSDSSISNGFELVTHPFTPDWGLEKIKFEAFQDLIDNFGALPTHDSCGTHIHVSKAAFDSAHLWKFLQIHHQLPDFCALVGGRAKNTNYGSFTEGSWRDSKVRLKEVAMSKRSDRVTRTAAVNLLPEQTIELRYPAGNISPAGIRKNIQWVKVLYEFSDYLDVGDVKDGALKTPGSLLWWINTHEQENPELVAHIQALIPTERPLKARN